MSTHRREKRIDWSAIAQQVKERGWVAVHADIDRECDAEFDDLALIADLTSLERAIGEHAQQAEYLAIRIRLVCGLHNEDAHEVLAALEACTYHDTPMGRFRSLLRERLQEARDRLARGP